MNSRRSNGDKLKDCRPICADKASGRGPLPGGGLPVRERALAGASGAPAGDDHARRAGIIPAVVLLLLAVLCAGCGQKGDLYLPDESPEARAGR